MMSNDSPQSAEPGADDLLARYARHEARVVELHPANKASLFAVLRTTNVGTVIVRFDGYGDSGQIEEITAMTVDQSECDLPETTIAMQQLSFGHDEPTFVAVPLRDAIDALSYAFLETVHGGWENNEGAFGDFTFDVAAGTLSLDYHERYISTEAYSHQF